MRRAHFAAWISLAEGKLRSGLKEVAVHQLLPEVLRPTTTMNVALPSGTVVALPVCRLNLEKWEGVFDEFTYGGKPIVMQDGQASVCRARGFTAAHRRWQMERRMGGDVWRAELLCARCLAPGRCVPGALSCPSSG